MISSLSFSLVLSKAALLNYNLFVKRLLQVHVYQSSTVADHCRSDALSDPKEPSFQATCDHDHSDVCERCTTLASTLNDIDEALVAQSQNMTSNTRTFFLESRMQRRLYWRGSLISSVLSIRKAPEYSFWQRLMSRLF